MEQQLENTKRLAGDAEQAKIDVAVNALVAALPKLKNSDAIDLLDDHGFSRNAARRLINDRLGRDWILAGTGTKIDPYVLKPPAGNVASQTPSRTGIPTTSITAATVAQGRQESKFKNSTSPTISGLSDSCRSLSDKDVEEIQRLAVQDAQAPEDKRPDREEFE